MGGLGYYLEYRWRAFLSLWLKQGASAEDGACKSRECGDDFGLRGIDWKPGRDLVHALVLLGAEAD